MLQRKIQHKLTAPVLEATKGQVDMLHRMKHDERAELQAKYIYV